MSSCSLCAMLCLREEHCGWIPDGGDTLSHLGRFCAVPAMVVIVVWQGAWRSRPATAEAMQGAAQGAQAFPEPELGLTGAHGVVGHALVSLAPWVQ